MRHVLFLPILFLACCDTKEPAAPVQPAKDPGAEAKAWFGTQDKTVITFVGFSGKGYQDEQAMRAKAEEFLGGHKPEETIVNIGVTPDGIGSVYELARKLGYTTSGVVSSLAREYPPSEFVDHPFYIEDESWGGIVEETGKLSPTSRAMVENSDIVVGIGGGEVARDELKAARAKGLEIHFFEAEMNHQKAIDKARKKGQPEPTDFRGAAAREFAP